MSPLESAIRASNHAVIRSGLASDFADWATLEEVNSSLHHQIGPVRSVALFRDRRAPLHHEFVLLSFGSQNGSPTSWVRLERAARRKAHWHMLQRDSFGPLFGGATLLESVSFGRVQEDLIHAPADELASISDSSGLEPKFDGNGEKYTELKKHEAHMFTRIITGRAWSTAPLYFDSILAVSVMDRKLPLVCPSCYPQLRPAPWFAVLDGHHRGLAKCDRVVRCPSSRNPKRAVRGQAARWIEKRPHPS